MANDPINPTIHLDILASELSIIFNALSSYHSGLFNLSRMKPLYTADLYSQMAAIEKVHHHLANEYKKQVIDERQD